MKKRYSLLIAFALSVFGSHAAATELVYTPINPSFGGSPLNGNFLKGMADAQNKLKEKRAEKKKDPIADFQKNLDRRVLSALANRLVDQSFGSYGDELATGRYELGDYTFEIEANAGEDVSVVITDANTGGTTKIVVPSYEE